MSSVTVAPRIRKKATGPDWALGEQVSAERLSQVAASHNLTDALCARIERVLGRTPSLTELGIFGVMYSEHCSYGSSRPYLKTFPTQGPRVLVPAGKENAGAVDLGKGLAVVFKCESHNHPSAVEPVQGAATGVGGILRDIFTMGARPVALLDSLRFGRPQSARTRFLMEGVVSGIAGYGNSVGVPTIGGEISFDSSYQDNPLVNVMCIGIIQKRALTTSAARGLNNPVLYVGSSTGRDGLGGASFASRELAEGSEADRPAVQIGDPFTEKCLIEATLEALATGDVIAIQDMGAAGLTCSTCETAARGHCGIEIDIAKVPRREAGMSPYEVMLSESQERMLLIIKPDAKARMKKLFAKWGLNAVVIGKITGGNRMRVLDQGALVADIPVGALTDDAPMHHRPVKRPRYLNRVQRFSSKRLPRLKHSGTVLKRLLASPTIADKASVYEQYDHMVQTNTVVLPGRADAAVIRLKGTGLLLAATMDGPGRYCYLDPYEGGKLAVAEAARNIVCVGAKPLAITDCLNFGSPEDPEILWQFKECIRGIVDACKAFGTPVIGGNVSFYNESKGKAIDPTPVVGMVGVIEPLSPKGIFRKPVGSAFQSAEDAVLILGATRDELGGSEYLMQCFGRKVGKPPRVDLGAEAKLQKLMVEACARGWVKSAHDCAEGGLAVAAAESCMMDPERMLGVEIDAALLPGAKRLRAEAVLFGESAGRILLSADPKDAKAILALAKHLGVVAARVGTVKGSRLRIMSWLDEPVEALREAWRSGLKRQLGLAR